jgi:radical SAM protein with 4Fe4S-binding SPASM domain
LTEAFAGIAEEIQFKTTWAMQWPSGAPSSGYDILWDDSSRKPVSSCSLIDDTLSIRANGDVVPCCFDLSSMEVLGNVADASLVDIWRGEAYQALRRDFAAGRYPKLCASCVVVTGDKFLLQQDGRGGGGPEGGQRWIPTSTLKARASG